MKHMFVGFCHWLTKENPHRIARGVTTCSYLIYDVAIHTTLGHIILAGMLVTLTTIALFKGYEF